MTLNLYHDFFPSEILAFTSKGPLSFSLGTAPAILSQAQKDFLTKHLGSPFPGLVNIHQVHGDKVMIATKKDLKDDHLIEGVDGILTSDVHVAIAVRTADCLPVFLYDPQNKAIGTIHAGWRSSQKKIVLKALELMKQKWGSEVKNVKVAFGPALRSCCYEVGEEFKDYFQNEVSKRQGKLFFDLPQVNRQQLLNVGIQAKNIFDCEKCTGCGKEFFSYRREGEKAGRMLSVMMIKS